MSVKSITKSVVLHPLGRFSFQCSRVGRAVTNNKFCAFVSEGISEGYQVSESHHIKRTLLKAYQSSRTDHEVSTAVANAISRLQKSGLSNDLINQAKEELIQEFQSVMVPGVA